MPPTKGKRVASMSPRGLLKIIEEYYPSRLDLMMDLSVGAIWEYHIKSPTLEDDEIRIFHLKKVSEERLELGMGIAPETPDLILYFTDQAVTELISSSPDAKTYYTNYSKIMKEGTGTRDLDYKVNKSWANLVKLGYKNWASRYGFMDQIGGPKTK
jgi:hypothetical protein